MKAIRITYIYSDIKQSLPLVLFFRMVGVYVIESFVHPHMDFKQEFAAIGAEKMEIRWDPCDADIFFPRNSADIEDYSSDLSHTLVVIPEKRLNGSDLKHVVYYESGDEDFILEVISELCRMHVIGSQESDELKSIAKIFCEKEYVSLVLKCNAMIPKNKENIHFFSKKDIKKNIDVWKEIINELLYGLIKDDIHKWGESRGERIQYSIAKASYELDVYCQKMQMNLAISPDSLIGVCGYMENFQDDSLQSALMVLKAQVYMDLLEDVTKGYDYLLSICDRCGDYNAYAFFLKGNYWLNDAHDYVNAAKYYVRAVERYPEYYRAWYRLGVAYYKMDDKSKALTAFETVAKILKPRMVENKLRVRETEQLFLSYKYCGGIYYEKYDNLRMAIVCYKNALRIYDAIEEGILYTQLGVDTDISEKIKAHTQELLEIDGMRERLNYWQELAVLTMGETI